MAAPAPDRQLVVFTMNEELYALPLSAVRETIRYTPPTATAAARGVVRGLINLRGRVLPVADLSDRLSRPLQVGTDSLILVLDLAAGELGLIVDSVEGVSTVPGNRVGPLPLPVADDALTHEIAAVDERLIMVIDAERALGGVLAPPAAPKRPAGEAE